MGKVRIFFFLIVVLEILIFMGCVGLGCGDVICVFWNVVLICIFIVVLEGV